MDRATIRILDANANRCGEALRTMEDIARFALDDAMLSEKLKSARHALRAAIEAMGIDGLARAGARDTEGDVGTTITVASERERRSLGDVAQAAGRRACESLRVLEECAKLEEGEACVLFEQLRYSSYDIAAQLVRLLGAARDDFDGWTLCLVLSESLCAHHGWWDVAKRVLAAGCDCVQLREKQLSDRVLLSRAQDLVAMCGEHGADFVVNDRVDIALRAGARGVHLGQDDLSVHDARALGPALMIGVSAGSLDEAIGAMREGASYAGVGAMFETATKHKDAIAGPGLLRQYLEHTPGLPPVLAIGGINEATLPELLTGVPEGRFGIAVSSALCGAEDPGQVAACLLAMMRDRAAAPAPQH
jgi:thiamine-phosphate pyrophosphorylase